jgi:NhaA family Na+:H+ antiporter
MSTRTLAHPAIGLPDAALVRRGLRFVVDHFLLLPIGGLVALLWANLQPESYFSFKLPLVFWVNEVGMTIFFAVIMQEVVESVVPGGALHTWRRWMLPVVAAAGATAASAGLYLAYIAWHHEALLMDGWPVATAIDLAFAYALVRTLFGRHPAVAFMLLVGIAANVFGFFALAHVFSALPSLGGLLLLAMAVGIAAVMHRWRVRNVWPYLLVAGPIAWWALYQDGLHPAIALVPIVPFMRHTARGLTFFEDRPHGPHASPRHLEHVLQYPFHLLLFLFGLINAGVLVTAYGTGTWAVVVASAVGKPIGLLLAVAGAVAMGFTMPRGLGWRDLGVVALATIGGFAFALFFATATYPLGPALAELKMGAIVSGLAVPLALGAAWLGGVGRFRAPGVRRSVI